METVVTGLFVLTPLLLLAFWVVLLAFPKGFSSDKKTCRHCRGTGVLHYTGTIAACHFCRDLDAELREAVKKVQKCSCKPFCLEQGGDGHLRCVHCNRSWGMAVI